MNITERIEKLIRSDYTFIIIFTLGTLLHLIPSIREYIVLTTPYILFFSIILLVYKLKLHPTLIAVLIMVAILGFTLEVIGTMTGVPFGEYLYGNILGFSIFNVPVIIAFNWSIIILCSYIFAQQAISKIKYKYLVFTPILTAIIATLFDYVMEPVAIYLNYWRWDGILVPTSNYITWFVFSLIASIFIYITTNGTLLKNHKWALSYIIAQLIFFTILNISIL